MATTRRELEDEDPLLGLVIRRLGKMSAREKDLITFVVKTISRAFTPTLKDLKKQMADLDARSSTNAAASRVAELGTQIKFLSDRLIEHQRRLDSYRNHLDRHEQKIKKLRGEE